MRVGLRRDHHDDTSRPGGIVGRQEMITKLQEGAAKLGADAIILRTVQEGSWGMNCGGSTGFDRGNADAIAIKFN